MADLRDSLTVTRMNAQRLVVTAAALTTLVAAAVAVTFALFSGVALPRAVRDNLTTAAGTTLVVSGQAATSQIAGYTAQLRLRIGTALAGTPFAFASAEWSDPLGFTGGATSTPPAAGAGNTPLVEAAALGGVTAHAILVAGRWPGTPQAGALRAGQPIPAALPAPAAVLLHVQTGDQLRLRDRESGQLISFRVSGLYRPRQPPGPAAGYWDLNDVGAGGATTASGFTTYGPLTVPAAAFAPASPAGGRGAAGPLAVSSGSWVAQPQVSRIPDAELGPVAANVSQLVQSLPQSSTLSSLALTTSLPAVLDGTLSDLSVARSLLAICAVAIGLLAAVTLLVVARLLAGQREEETALLTARGATRRQLAQLALAEAVPLCVLAAAAGTLLGRWAAGRLGASGLPTGGGLAAWLAGAAIAAAAALILLVPVLQSPLPGAARARRGRQAAVAGITRAGADVALILLAILAGWELRRYSAAPSGVTGGHGVDPVLVAAPALALTGGAIAVLRLLPAASRAGDRLAARGRRLTVALASWQISRQPIRQGGAALLVVLSVATGMLMLAARQSAIRSDHDQAALTAGADVRVQTPEPLTAGQAARLSRVAGVRHAMPVAVFPGSAASGETLAVDASQAAAVTLLRPDQSPRPAAQLFRWITPAGPATGTTLTGHPERIQLTASIGPSHLALTPVVVTLDVRDPAGDDYQVPAGTLATDGHRHVLTAAVPGGDAIYPLRLTGITAAYTLPARRAAVPAVLTVQQISGAPGTAPQPGSALDSWAANASSPELSGVRATSPGTAGPSGLPAVRAVRPGSGPGSSRTVSFDPGYGLSASGVPSVPPLPVRGQISLSATARLPAAIPGIATSGFLAASHLHPGSTVEVPIGGVTVSVRIAAVVTSFPTAGPGTDALIVDLATVQDVLASASAAPAQPGQWWLATTAGRVPSGLAAALPGGTSVTAAATLTTALLSDPVAAVPRSALVVVAMAASMLAIIGCCVSIAAGIRRRRAETALLAALGFSPRAAAGQLGLERLMLSVPSALAGLALGAIVAELLVPAITLTASATAPDPAVLVELDWRAGVALAVVVAVVPAVAAALAMAWRPDPAAALRAAEAA